MHNTIRRDGILHNVVVVPDGQSAVNREGNHSVRGGKLAQKLYNPTNATQDRLQTPMIRVNDSLLPISWDDATSIVAELSRYAIDKLGVYKLRSTPNGELPTEQDLFNTITNGVSNSMMPAFGSLSEKERWALVEVIRRFGGIEQEQGEAITVMQQPEVTAASVANGKQLYEQLECSSCHGTSGHGDGPSSLTLENDAEERVWAANLTSGIYKGGADPVALYQRIANGLDGSPMPSYSEEAKPEEIWDLVHFLQTLVVQE